MKKTDVSAALDEIRTRPTVAVWPTLGRALGWSKYASYKAARDGQIEVLRFGKDSRRMQAITAPIRKRLGMDT
jgi:hypothetical protein